MYFSFLLQTGWHSYLEDFLHIIVIFSRTVIKCKSSTVHKVSICKYYVMNPIIPIRFLVRQHTYKIFTLIYELIITKHPVPRSLPYIWTFSIIIFFEKFVFRWSQENMFDSTCAYQTYFWRFNVGTISTLSVI